VGLTLEALESQVVLNQTLVEGVEVGSKKNKRKQGAAGAVSTEIRSVAPAPSSPGVSKLSRAGSKFWTSRYFEWMALTVASVISYWILTARLVGVNVSVLIDEYSYVLDAHYTALEEASYPNQLFQLIYSSTKLCGSEFYTCARGINSLFVIGSGLVLYFLGKYVSRNPMLGAVAAIGGLFGSLGTYTAYFMPEAIFNFWILLFFYLLVRLANSKNLALWSLLGLVLGISSLAKPHAFFVVPALVIFIVLAARASNVNYIRVSFLRTTVFISALVATKFILGFAIGGERAVSIFGRYGTVESATGLAATTLVQNSGLDALTTSWGQTMMIVIIAGVALPVALLGFITTLRKDTAAFQQNKVRSLVAISLLNMMAVSALFEAWLGLSTWMHTRYYSYLIPLLVIALIEAFINSESIDNKKVKVPLVLLYLVIGSIALVTAGIPYGANWIDAPDFRAHIDNHFFSSVFIFVALCLAVSWIWSTKIVLAVAIGVTVVSFVLSGTYISTFLQSTFGRDTTYDHLGRVLRDFLPQDELDRTVLIGDNNTTMERALFSSLSGEARALLAPLDGVDVTKFEDDVQWIVRVGEPTVSGLGSPVISGDGFSIHKVSSGEPSRPRSNSLVSVSNLCDGGAELGWTCGSSSVVDYRPQASGQVVVDLVLEISDIAAQGDLEFQIGQSSFRGTLPQGNFALTISFAGETKGGQLLIRATPESPAAQSGVDQKFVRVISVNAPKR
jgi:phosphoglycerol transferase